jgi:hypothetical protein
MDDNVRNGIRDSAKRPRLVHYKNIKLTSSSIDYLVLIIQCTSCTSKQSANILLEQISARNNDFDFIYLTRLMVRQLRKKKVGIKVDMQGRVS